MKLSIIIPYYNAKEYTDELLKALAPQITSEVEVILVDDGSDKPYKTRYKWPMIIRKTNGGCASARNMGLEVATGDYVSFIDADDLVPEYYVKKLFEKIDETNADVIDFSWKSLSSEGAQFDNKLKDGEWLKNPSVCTRAFRRSFIGDVRFNIFKDSTEDEDFSRKLGYLDRDTEMVHATMSNYMYFYRTAVTDSKIKRFKKGLMNTKRVAYYYKHVTADMTWLLEEIKRDDERNEVWLLTEQCDIPELKRYCQIHKPKRIWAHVQKGEPFDIDIITPPIKTQVVVYCEYANKIGGIPTFIYNFCQQMKEYYDILVLYDELSDEQVRRLKRIVRTRKNDKTEITCDTIILNRLTDKIPQNVTYKKSIQICHACHQKTIRIPAGRDILVNVSESSKASWGAEASQGVVINNMTYKSPSKLFLVSATRMARAKDKGDNETRMRKLAEMLNHKKIPFVWLNFSDKPMENPPSGFINMDPRLDVQEFIKRADYLVQLSDQEAYSYATLEALDNNTAVICTPVDSFMEQGVVDTKTGYIIPFEMDFDVSKLMRIPRFKYSYDNESRIMQWREILGNTMPKKDYKPEIEVEAEVLKNFTDKHTGVKYKRGMQIILSQERVEEIRQKGEYVKVLE